MMKIKSHLTCCLKKGDLQFLHMVGMAINFEDDRNIKAKNGPLDVDR